MVEWPFASFPKEYIISTLASFAKAEGVKRVSGRKADAAVVAIAGQPATALWAPRIVTAALEVVLHATIVVLDNVPTE